MQLWTDSSLVSVRAPCKIFGDLHGQFEDLLRFFWHFVSPRYDLEYVHYLFLGDYVDRGTHRRV